MNKIELESVVIVKGELGSVATIHFSDPKKSCYISSSSKQILYTLVEKKIRKVLNA